MGRKLRSAPSRPLRRLDRNLELLVNFGDFSDQGIAGGAKLASTNKLTV
jgi:hypothetical protein